MREKYKYTPKPWTLKQIRSTIDTHDWLVQAKASDDGRTVDICRCYPITDDGQVGSECHNNARLIARLPEMFKALDRIANGVFLEPGLTLEQRIMQLRHIAGQAIAGVFAEEVEE